ncbi:modulator of macroautophagy TMEM150B isoform X5 [Elephas maximus indicus]|nr:modulator of macroautophagy TMEM150B isoform X5 [Elephas maximus indicus]
MWGYLSLLPAFLAIWAVAGIWTVFALAVANKSVNLNEGFPYISICGSYPPQSCLFSQVLNMGAALAAWICILRYHQLQDWGVTRRFNQLILWTGLLSALGTSMVGNFQQKNQKPTHLTGAFLAFFVGILYFWLQLLLFWRKKNLPQPGSPWIGPLRLGLCTICTILMDRRRDTDTQEEGYVKTEAEIGVMRLQANDCQQYQKLRGKTWNRFSLQPSEGTWPC